MITNWFVPSQGHSELMRLLIYSGFNPKQKDNFGQTALHLACINGNITAVKELCEEVGRNIICWGMLFVWEQNITRSLQYKTVVTETQLSLILSDLACHYDFNYSYSFDYINLTYVSLTADYKSSIATYKNSKTTYKSSLISCKIQLLLAKSSIPFIRTLLLFVGV